MNERSIFLEALEISAPAERAAFLDRACNGDAALRTGVEGLLAADNRSGSFMQRPAGGDVTADHQPAEGPGNRVGPYKLLQEIGEGGMGTVFMADQEQPVRRKVALKIIRPGMDSKQVVARFEAERQALSMMDHPNIAKVLDAGTTDSGRPYFVMELVHGVPITTYCDENKLTPRERLGLFVPVCQAIQHAHQKGIIHRDIKPSNILVTMYDDKPVPKVIDFGVAKAVEQRLTEKTLFTQFGSTGRHVRVHEPRAGGDERFWRGHPERCLLPRSAALRTADGHDAAGATTAARSGAGRSRPADQGRGAASAEPAAQHDRDPGKGGSRRKTDPGKLSAVVRGELDWIVMRCLEKDRTRRYDTASGLANDVERYLKDEPVEACPPTLGYRMRKVYRKNRGPVIAASIVLFVLLAGIIGTSAGLIQANRARRGEIEQRNLAEGRRVEALADRDDKIKALAAETEAKQEVTEVKNGLQTALTAEQQATYDMTIAQVQKALEECDQPRAAELLASCPEKLRGWEWHYLTQQFDRNAILLRPSFGPGRTGFDAAYPTPDGRELLVLTANPLGLIAQRWETATGKKVSENEISLPSSHFFRWYVVSPDRRLVAVWVPPTNFVKPRGLQLNRMVPENVPAEARSVRIYDLHTAALVGEIRGHTNWIYHVLFSNDSKQLVTGSSDRTIRFWDVTGKPGMVLSGHTKAVAIPLAFTPDGRTLVAAGREFKAVSRDENGTQRNIPAEKATSERDEWFAWDLDTQKPRTKGELAGVPLENFVGYDANVSVSADGRYAILPDWVVSAVVDLTTGQRAVALGWHTEPIGFTPSGKSALLLSGVGVLSVFDLAAGKVDRNCRLSIPTADVLENLVMGNGTHAWNWNLSRDGRVLAIGRDGERKTVIVDTVTGREVGFVADKRSAFVANNKPFVGGRDKERAIADDGSFFTSSDSYGEIKLWKLGPVRRAIDFSRVTAAPDGRFGSTLPGSVISTDGRRVLTRKHFRGNSKQSLEEQIRN